MILLHIGLAKDYFLIFKFEEADGLVKFNDLCALL